MVVCGGIFVGRKEEGVLTSGSCFFYPDLEKANYVYRTEERAARSMFGPGYRI